MGQAADNAILSSMLSTEMFHKLTCLLKRVTKAIKMPSRHFMQEQICNMLINKDLVAKWAASFKLWLSLSISLKFDGWWNNQVAFIISPHCHTRNRTGLLTEVHRNINIFGASNILSQKHLLAAEQVLNGLLSGFLIRSYSDRGCNFQKCEPNDGGNIAHGRILVIKISMFILNVTIRIPRSWKNRLVSITVWSF